MGVRNPGEPVDPRHYWSHTGIAWTGERNPFGVRYAYPEWHRYPDAPRGHAAWQTTDRHRVRWTLERSDVGPLSLTHWCLTERSHGWRTVLQITDYGTDVDSLPLADRIVRNVINMPDVIERYHRPALRPSVERMFEDDVIWWHPREWGEDDDE